MNYEIFEIFIFSKYILCYNKIFSLSFFFLISYQSVFAYLLKRKKRNRVCLKRIKK